MIADTLTVETRKLYGPHKSSDPINITVEGQDSIFWLKNGSLEIPGTRTKLLLRKKKNPWEELSEDEFIKAVENVVPNPPFNIQIITENKIENRDENSFYDTVASSLKDYSWTTHENLREIEIKLDDPNNGILGSAIIGILEKHGKPVTKIDMQSKEVEVDGKKYNLDKEIKISDDEIKLYSTTITIDDDGNIETDSSTRSMAKSKSRLALHGVEVPTTLFPLNWRIKQNQVKLAWPFPMLIIVDICGTRDLDLNSARNTILIGDNWTKFEEELSKLICKKISCSVSAEYWSELKSLFKKSNSKAFLNGLNEIKD